MIYLSYITGSHKNLRDMQASLKERRRQKMIEFRMTLTKTSCINKLSCLKIGIGNSITKRTIHIKWAVHNCDSYNRKFQDRNNRNKNFNSYLCLYSTRNMTVSTSRCFYPIIGWSKIPSSYLYSIYILFLFFMIRPFCNP